jgi:hypothetical protein
VCLGKEDQQIGQGAWIRGRAAKEEESSSARLGLPLLRRAWGQGKNEHDLLQDKPLSPRGNASPTHFFFYYAVC